MEAAMLNRLKNDWNLKLEKKIVLWKVLFINDKDDDYFIKRDFSAQKKTFYTLGTS